MERIERPSILEGNILYLMLGILLWVVGSIVHNEEVYSGILITEYIVILLPNLIYLKLRGFSLGKILRLNKISFKQIRYIILITIVSYPIAIFFNFIMTMILSVFGNIVQDPVPMADSLLTYFISLFVIALAPGICEEVMFRGIIMSAYSNLGKKKAIIYSAILFGVFHLNLQNLLGPTVLGMVLGITVYKTNSIYASILGHTLSNGIAVTIGYFATKSIDDIGDGHIPAFEIPNNIQMLILFFILAIFAIIATFILIKLLRGLPEGKETTVIEPVYRGTRTIDYIPLLGIIALFTYINLIVFFL